MANFVAKARIDSLTSDEGTSFDFQANDFEVVWGNLSPDSLSDEEQVLFEKSTDRNENAELWQDLEFLQPNVEKANMETFTKIADYGNERVNNFDEIFLKGVSQNSEAIRNDPMMSLSFDLATPQHPFEETLDLMEDSVTDIANNYSTQSPVYYSSSSDDEHAENSNLNTIKSTKENTNDIIPNGYPSSIHSYSQCRQETADQDTSSDDEEEKMDVNTLKTDSVMQEMSQNINTRYKSPSKMRNKRRQEKATVIKITQSEIKQATNSSKKTKNSPQNKKFSNGKVKLYAVKHFADPTKERARQNAVNAKINRERKKKEREMVYSEVASLRQENGTLKRFAAASKKRAAAAETELQRLRAIIRENQLEHIIKASGK